MKILNLTSRKYNNPKIAELSVSNFNKIKKLTTITESISSEEVFDHVDQIVEIAVNYFNKQVELLYQNHTEESLKELLTLINNKQVLINPHPLIAEHLVPALRDKGIMPVYGIYKREIKPNDSKPLHYTLSELVAI